MSSTLAVSLTLIVLESFWLAFQDRMFVTSSSDWLTSLVGKIVTVLDSSLQFSIVHIVVFVSGSVVTWKMNMRCDRFGEAEICFLCLEAVLLYFQGNGDRFIQLVALVSWIITKHVRGDLLRKFHLTVYHGERQRRRILWRDVADLREMEIWENTRNLMFGSLLEIVLCSVGYLGVCRVWCFILIGKLRRSHGQLLGVLMAAMVVWIVMLRYLIVAIVARNLLKSNVICKRERVANVRDLDVVLDNVSILWLLHQGDQSENRILNAVIMEERTYLKHVLEIPIKTISSLPIQTANLQVSDLVAYNPAVLFKLKLSQTAFSTLICVLIMMSIERPTLSDFIVILTLNCFSNFVFLPVIFKTIACRSIPTTNQ